jgi:anaerobic ribonucleoside-triphosphate reductase activating protein
MKIAGTIKHSMVNGPGIRFVVFFQGCIHHCKGCQNMDTWDIDGGDSIEPEELMAFIKNTKLLDGVTLSGGDPFMQARDAAIIAKSCHEMGLSVWCYTGYTYEQIIGGEAPDGAKDLLTQTDVLVDGRFVESLKSKECLYRGSTNQRLIDVQQTIASGYICDWKQTD